MPGKWLRSVLALSLLLSLGMIPAGVPDVAAADNWTAQSSGTTLSLNEVAAVDANTAWIVGGSATTPVILKTTNGGTTWASQTTSVAYYLQSVAAVNSNVAWATGYGTTILKTVDGGTNWTGQTAPASLGTVLISAVGAGDADTAWALAYTNVIGTTDGGSNWDVQGTASAELYGLAVVSATTVWAVGGTPAVPPFSANNVVLKTTNGSTWTSQTVSVTSNRLNAISAVNGNVAWAVGDSGTIITTSDGGTNWTAQTSGTATTLRAVYAQDANTVWAAGDGGTILKTTNGGTTWTAQTSGATSSLYGMAGVNTNSTVWAVGFGGAIVKTAGSSLTQSVSVQQTSVSVGVSPSTVSYGAQLLGTTTTSGTLTATNTGSSSETFLVQGSNAVATVTGESNWTLAGTPGANIYSNDFKLTSGSSYAPLTTAPQTLASSVTAAGTSDFTLQLRMPTSSTGNGLRNITVTITATAP